MSIQPIMSVSNNAHNINFVEKQYDEMPKREYVTSNLKAIPLAVLLAMSPLNAVDIKAQDDNYLLQGTEENDEIHDIKATFLNATPTGGICDIESSYDEKNNVEKLILNFPTEKFLKHFDKNGEPIECVKYLNTRLMLDSIKSVEISSNKDKTTKYYLMGSGTRSSSQLMNKETNEVVNQYSAHVYEEPLIKQEVSKEFFDYIKSITDENSVKVINEKILSIMGL